MHERITVALTLALSLGCGTAHAPDEVAVHVDHPSMPVTTEANLDGCFGGGGSLVELGAVNNDDQADHGALLTFGISPAGVVAAAGADGTLKFWTMNDTLIGSATPNVLTYGPEIGGVPITDLAFSSDHAIAGDISGIVQQLAPNEVSTVIGGTMPDVPIASVAFDRVTQRLAHAQHGEGATPLVIQAMDGSLNANIDDTLSTITDLQYTVEGALVVGGQNSDLHAAIEIRDATDPTIVVGRPNVGTDTSVVEVATASEGSTIVVATTRSLYAITSTSATLLATSDADLRSVDLTPSGDYALTVDANGLVSVRSTVDGHEVATTSIASGLGVRVSSDGQRIVVGATDAMLHVLSCAP